MAEVTKRMKGSKLLVEEQKVRQAIAGDKKALDELLQRFRPLVFRWVSKWVESPSEAEDVTQEVLFQAVRQIRSLRQPARFRQWLWSIAKNCAKMWLRSHAVARRQGLVSFHDYFSPDLPSDEFVDEPLFWRKWEVQQTVEEWLSTLPPRWGAAMRLHFLYGYSEREVAQQLGVPITTVVNDLHRAKQRLREAIGMQKQRLHEVRTTVREELPIRDRMPLVVYGLSAVKEWCICASNDNTLRLEVVKTGWGWTEQEARRHLRRIVTRLQPTGPLSLSAPFEAVPFKGRFWSSTWQKGEKGIAVYAPHEDVWRHLIHRWQILDPFSWQEAQEQWAKGVILAVVTDDRLEGVQVSADQVPVFFPVELSFTLDGKQVVFGKGATAQVRLFVPDGIALYLFADGALSFSEFSGAVVCISNWASLTLQRVRGNFRLLGGVILTEAEGCEGNLLWRMPADSRGVCWGERIARYGEPPTSRLRQIRGDVDILVKCVHLVLQDINGTLRVENEFGDTEVWLSEMREGQHWQVRSVTGNVTAFFSPKVAQRLKVHLLTECGTIDRSQWQPKGRTFWHNNLYEIFLGTSPRSQQPFLTLFSRNGTVKVVETPAVNPDFNRRKR